MQALHTLAPLGRQIFLSGYIFAMQMPVPIVLHFLKGGNYSLLRGVHLRASGGIITPYDAAEGMASSMGPSVAEFKSKTASGDTYPATLENERAFAHVMHMAGYYRDHASVARWEKSIETIASLHSISGGTKLRRSSSGAGLFDEGPAGAFQASSTIFWGQQDIALDQRICLDGMADFLVNDSQIVLLPRTGHWTPVEPESRAALIKAVEWAAHGEQGDVGAVIQKSYPGAKVTARR
jgi:pimeloyl-ACP methyl ester carboxylesterase